MSLRKSTCLTPWRLDAARHNSERSTGPRSEAGKQRMRMNALKHGCDAAAENEAAVMRALGEDPERYAALKRELATAYGPGDALWDRQLEDLAKLYWRRQRFERMETGLMRRALEAVEERQRSRRDQIAAATFEPSKLDATDLELGEPTDPRARLRQDDSPAAQPAAGPPDNESNDREAQELSKLVGLDPARESGAGVPPAVPGASRPRKNSRAEPVLSAAKECPRHSGRDARTTNLAADHGVETSKSPKQSENVIENKEPAAQGVNA
jgi:hypothetical protein